MLLILLVLDSNSLFLFLLSISSKLIISTITANYSRVSRYLLLLSLLLALYYFIPLLDILIILIISSLKRLFTVFKIGILKLNLSI